MRVHIQQVLAADEVAHARQLLHDAPWSDGRATAGEQAAQAKNNQQLPEGSRQVETLQAMVLKGLRRHAMFFSASLPKQVSPPLFNRYAGANNAFGNHVDAAVRYLSDGEGRVRTDISCTLFLSEPHEYDGGELVTVDPSSEQRTKLAAGDLLLYPASTVHRVEPVTRGERLAAFFWIESMVREDSRRRLLFEMDQHLIALRTSVGETDPAVIGLTATYHNLLRMWIDT